VVYVWGARGHHAPPELVDEVEGAIPTILPPEEVLELGSEAQSQDVSGARCVEGVGIANSGFAGREPEIVAPQELLRELLGEVASVVLAERVLADGSGVLMPRLTEPLEVYLVAEDRVEGPVKSYAYMTRGRFILLNDALLSKLRIVILDPYEGLWCFRDELGRVERRGV
jgi:hypothetical protein